MIGYRMVSVPVSPVSVAQITNIYKFLEYDNPRTYVGLSRYRIYRQIIAPYTHVRYLESYNQTEIIETEADRYITVNIKNENRLDMIAFEAYKSSTYWWVVALANNIIDPFNVPVGTVLRIPPMSSLYTSRGVVMDVG